MASQQRGGSLMRYRSTTVNALILLNILMFALTYLEETGFLGSGFVSSLALYHPLSENFRYYQFFTHMFMHGSVFHIAINMFVLWMFGSVLEGVWGRKKFLIFYFVTGLGAAGLHMATSTYRYHNINTEIEQFASNPSYDRFDDYKDEYIDDLPKGVNRQYDKMIHSFDSLETVWQESGASSRLHEQSTDMLEEYYQSLINRPTVGASGAIYGLLLAFGLLFPNILILLFFIIPLKAKYFVIFIGLFELYRGVFGDSLSIAHFAHLGGMLFGFILLKIWKVRRGEAEEVVREQEQKQERGE